MRARSVRRDPDVGVEIEAVELGLPRTARGGVTEILLPNSEKRGNFDRRR